MDCNGKLTLYNSEGNFLLLKTIDEATHSQLLQTLQQKGILVLNTTASALLKNTIRISIGTPQENNLFINCLSTITGEKNNTQTAKYITLQKALTPIIEKSQFN